MYALDPSHSLFELGHKSISVDDVPLVELVDPVPRKNQLGSQVRCILGGFTHLFVQIAVAIGRPFLFVSTRASRPEIVPGWIASIVCASSSLTNYRARRKQPFIGMHAVESTVVACGTASA